MGRTDQLVRYSDGRYLTFDPAEVAGCSAAPYATDTRQSARLHSLRASRLSPPTPPHYARACVLRWDVWMVRSSQISTYCACAGGRGAEADLRHVSVSERPTTDIRETCTSASSAGRLLRDRHLRPKVAGNQRHSAVPVPRRRGPRPPGHRVGGLPPEAQGPAAAAAHGSLETFGSPQRHAIAHLKAGENGDSEYVIRYAGKIRPFLNFNICVTSGTIFFWPDLRRLPGQRRGMAEAR